jgi:citrate lyase beta subunit
MTDDPSTSLRTSRRPVLQVRRALLYIPGDSRRKIEKAAALGVDSLCLDLEDGVAVSQKQAARETIGAALRELDFGQSERLVRINRFGSGLEVDDLTQVMIARPDGIVLPKVEEAEPVKWLDAQITEAEQVGENEIVIIAMIETARGVVNLKEIAGASPRLAGLIFGAEDLAGDMGATRTTEAWEVFYARSAVVTHAAAFGLQAIDMVYRDYNDTEGLIREARQGAEMGYAGKQAIHPNQTAPIQEAFTPSAEAIAQAKRIVEAHAAHQASGVGAFALDGKMVDRPVVKAAEQVLAKARAAGKIQS